MIPNPNDKKGRIRRTDFWLRWILLLFVALGLTYALVTPVFEASDELWHYPMIRHLADGNPLPVQAFDPALAEAKRIMEGLEDDAENVRFLFITVDPERDTPERLGQYVANFHPDITGLRGTPAELQAMFDAYGIYAAKVPLEDSAAEYTMEHTARVFLVDQDGRLRLSYAFGTPDEDILQDVQYLLR